MRPGSTSPRVPLANCDDAFRRSNKRSMRSSNVVRIAEARFHLLDGCPRLTKCECCLTRDTSYFRLHRCVAEIMSPRCPVSLRAALVARSRSEAVCLAETVVRMGSDETGEQELASRTVRDATPMWPSVSSVLLGALGTSPKVPLNPNSPVNAAGMRIDPAPSVPMASGPMPEETGDGSLPIHPASGSRPTGFSWSRKRDLLSRLSSQTPGYLSFQHDRSGGERRTAREPAHHEQERRPSQAREPPVVLIPLVAIVSLTVIGIPGVSLRRTPDRYTASAALACW